MLLPDKKKVILRIADRLFAHYGFRKTTMDEIAKACMMAKSSLYYYFQNKEDIFAEVIQQDSEKFREQLNTAINSVSSPQQKIIEYINTRLKHLRALKNYYTTLTDEYFEHYIFIDEIRNEFYDQEKKTLIILLEEGMNQDVFVIQDLELTSRMISIIIKGLEYPLLIRKSDFDIELEITQLMNIFFIGILKK